MFDEQADQLGVIPITRKISMRCVLLFSLLSLFLLVGCSGVNEKEAEAIAKSFVKTHVKFYAKTSEQAVDITTYDLRTVRIYQQGNKWNVVLNVTAKQGGTEKKGLLLVIVDAKKGKAVDLKRLG